MPTNLALLDDNIDYDMFIGNSMTKLGHMIKILVTSSNLNLNLRLFLIEKKLSEKIMEIANQRSMYSQIKHSKKNY